MPCEKQIMTEKQLQQKILKILGSNPVFRLFRNNVGNAWMGRLYDSFRDKNFIGLHNPRRVQFGLCPGSSDLIGLKKITITPDMIGKEIAQFVSIEIKSKKGKLTKEQKNWQEMVKNMGGLAVNIYDIDDIPPLL